MTLRPPRRFLASAVLLMAAVFVCTYLLRSPQVDLSRQARFLVAVAPVPIALWVIGEFVRTMRGADEFARRVMLEALAIAYPVALLLGMTVEYLQKGGFLPGVDVGRLWPVQGLVLVIAFGYAHWRYR